MPELPEVETTRLGLLPRLQGRTLSRIVVRNPHLRWPVPDDLEARLAGHALSRLDRRGKYLLFDFGAATQIVHLGMSGSLRFAAPDEPAALHDHVDWVFDDGTTLRLRDPRRFGAILWTTQPPEAHPLIRHLGIEPLSRDLDTRRLHALTRGHRTAIKQFLMNGQRVVGIGNIYASESLFLAAIHPRTRAGRLSVQRSARLVRAVKDTLRAAIRAGGSSLRDFVGSDGAHGCFQRRAWVYGREGQKCRRCGAQIRRIVQGQRATYYCPGCQK
jgi:formamidopyrimidine-DNA glycosylase